MKSLQNGHGQSHDLPLPEASRSAALKKNATSLVKLKKHIEGVVSAYEGNTASETFAAAVRFAYKLAAGEKI